MATPTSKTAINPTEIVPTETAVRRACRIECGKGRKAEEKAMLDQKYGITEPVLTDREKLLIEAEGVLLNAYPDFAQTGASYTATFSPFGDVEFNVEFGS